MSTRHFRNSIGLMLLSIHLCGCTTRTLVEEQQSSPIWICGDSRKDRIVTTQDYDYWGARETQGDNDADPALSAHAAAAEVVSTAGYGKFAVAWIRSNQLGAVRIFDVTSAQFTGSPQTLTVVGSAWWMAPLGHDPACAAVEGATSCAWFTWYSTSAGYNGIAYQAIGDNGVLSPVFINATGYEPSGAAGLVYAGSTKKLLAWIDQSRRTVYGAFVARNGSMGRPFRIQRIPDPYKAYQTAVVWSYHEQLFLVVWTQHGYPRTDLNGQVYTRWVDTNGGIAPYANFIMNCEGLIDADEHCPPGHGSIQTGATGIAAPSVSSSRSMITEPAATSRISNCSCKAIWVASSDYSYEYDRYRIQQYNKHARVFATGSLEFLFNRAATYSPMTKADYFHSEQLTPFQQLCRGEFETQYYHLAYDSETEYPQGGAISGPHIIGQAMTSTDRVAIGVSTQFSSPFSLKMSILDVYPGGCPNQLNSSF
jgi:hypothetical protein